MKLMVFPISHSILMTQGGIPMATLKQFLDLMPADTVFHGAGRDDSRGLHLLYFASDQFLIPDYNPNSPTHIPELVPIFRGKEDGTVFCEDIQYPNGNFMGCRHFWVWYQGFHESYEYCETCKERR